MPATVSLRIGAVLSSITSATTLRGLSSLIDRIWPAGTPSKLTGPPRRNPLAEPPSNTTRNWLRLWRVRHFCTPSTPPHATAITASVAVPITRLLARAMRDDFTAKAGKWEAGGRGRNNRRGELGKHNPPLPLAFC